MANARDRMAARASMEATRLHQRLEAVNGYRVAVFDAVRSQRVWLMTQPMTWSLYGFSLREGDAVGMCLNALHPEPMQRFTCAHELGHLILGHEAAIDHDRQVDHGPTASAQEIQAQAFASSFIMPVANVSRALRTIAADEYALTAGDAYRLSRLLDVSFAAVCWRLVELEMIARPTAQHWSSQGPRAARRQLAAHDDGRELTILYQDSARSGARARVGDALMVDMLDHADAGYEWRIAGEEPAASVLDWDGGARVRLSSSDGAPPHSRTALLPTVGATRVPLELVRPWSSEPAAAAMVVTVAVGPEHEVESLDPVQRRMLAVR